MAHAGERPELSVEDGWRRLADGMHIHRWFLHCGREGAEPRVPGAPVRLCGRTVVVAGEQGRPGVDRADDLLGDDLAEQVSSYVDWAELGYLVRLAVRAVLVTGEGATAVPVADADDEVRVECSGSAVVLAEQLSAGAGACWLRRFVASAPETLAGRSPDASTLSAALQLVRVGVAFRFLEAVCECPWLPPGDAGVARRRYDECLQRVRELRNGVGDVVAALPLIAADLAGTLFPWPGRFARYEGGGGIGQSE